jgi:purine-binding chemotaxis protein CheW
VVGNFMGTEVLIIECADHFFGLDVSEVREVLRAVALSPTPHAHQAMLGMMNLRGQVLPVLDTAWIFGFGSSQVRPTDHFVVLSSEDARCAVRVDRAVDLVEIRLDAVDDEQSELSSPWFNQMAKTRFGLVPVIAMEQIFADVQLAEIVSIRSSVTATESTS